MITGGSGFIGSHFHLYLRAFELVNLDLKHPDFEHGATFVQGDICEPGLVEKTLAQHECECIIHLAAEHKDFGVTTEAFFRTNEYGTRLVCEAAAKNNVKKIIYFSSVAVYGQTESPSHEGTATQPNSPYGKSKLAAERVLEDWAQADPERKVVILRPTVVYGERNVANMYRLIEKVKSGFYFNIGKGDNIKSIAYVKNLVEATLYLRDRMKPGVEIYNYSDDAQMSVRQITDTISSALGYRNSISLPYWMLKALALPFDVITWLTGKDIGISSARIKKLKTQTYHRADKIRNDGFVPRFSNEEGLQAMVNWVETGDGFSASIPALPGIQHSR